MATNRFRGDAQAVAQVSTFTVTGSWTAGDTVTLTMGNKTLVLTLGSTSAASASAVVAAIVAAWNGATITSGDSRTNTGDHIPEFAEVTASGTSSPVTLTADTAGKPFTVTVSRTTGSSGAVGTVTTSTSNAGPNCWDTAANWSQGVIPQGAVSAPTLNATSLASGGSLSSGTTYYYELTAINANGETTASGEVSGTPSGGNLKVVNTWTAMPGATAYKLYRTTVSGSYSGSHFLATISGNSTVTYTDDGTISLTSGSPPGGNTATGDDVYIENSDVDIKYGLDQSTITLASLSIAQSYSGKLGLPDYDTDSNSYYQYRDKYLKISPTTLNIGYGPGSGSGRIKINGGTTVTTINTYGTGQPAEQGLEAFLFVGTHSSNVLNANAGSIGIAVEAGQTATLATVRCGFEGNQTSDVALRLGSGCTLTTLTQSGGTLETNSAFTTLTKTGGTCTLRGSGNITTVTNDAGDILDQNTGTKTTVNVGNGASVSRTGVMLTTTYTNTNLYGGSSLSDPNKLITFTNPFAIVRCGLRDVTLDLGENISLQRS